MQMDVQQRGAGFIGSAFVRMAIGETDLHVVNLDKLTYAGNLENLTSKYVTLKTPPLEAKTNLVASKVNDTRGVQREGSG